MTYYVIAAARRIQQWLVRTPELRLLRGASRALAEATQDAAIEQLLSDASCSAKPCADAGNIDGIVAVECPDAASASQARALLERHLRSSLPGLEWVLWSGGAKDYAQALDRSKQQADVLLPSSLVVPFAQRCTGCGAEMGDTEPAESEDRGLDRNHILGPDCLRRFEHGATGQSDRFAVDKGLAGRTVYTFDRLAKVTGRATFRAEPYGGKRNHLALVAADGNGIGSLFEQLSATASPELRGQAAGLLRAATEAAVATAVLAVSESPSSDRPAILHYEGGDDVLISVPAPLAWRFVVELSEQFSRCVTGQFQSAPEPIRAAVARTSLGIGMVISHLSYPLASAQELAEAAMKSAKKQVQGSCGAVNWLDLTAEAAVSRTRHFRTTELKQLLDDPTANDTYGILTLPSTARAVLTQIVNSGLERWRRRRDTEVSELAEIEAEVWFAVNSLLSHAQRTNRRILLEMVSAWVKTATVSQASDPRTDVEHLAAALGDLGHWLSLARWWPTVALVDDESIGARA